MTLNRPDGGFVRRVPETGSDMQTHPEREQIQKGLAKNKKGGL